MASSRTIPWTILLISLSLVLYELLLTRLFAVVLFAQFAHLALALALLGIGVGAIMQHLWPKLVPEEGLEKRLGWFALILGASAFLAVVATLNFPVLKDPEILPTNYQERSGIPGQLLNVGWYTALLPILALPFGWGGLAVSGTFQRLRDRVGGIYAADLCGGAAGALLFLPALSALSGPDTAFVVTLASAAAALLAFYAGKSKVGMGVAGSVALLSLVAIGFGRFSGEVLQIRTSAGYSEQGNIYVRWTPLTRLSVYKQPEKYQILLDNSSASDIPLTQEFLDNLKGQWSRSFVYMIHDPPARVAILAASAGPEVGVAQSLGYSDIDAVDIASEIFEIVADRFPDNPFNPYTKPGVRRVHADGRAAILQSAQPYDIIQMVHANLWSAAGLLSNAWSPSLLETQEAFATYLDHLTPDGTISFGRGTTTAPLVPAALAALKERGVAEPRKCIAYLEGNSAMLLVKQRPWTEAEGQRLHEVLAQARGERLVIDPMATTVDAAAKKAMSGKGMTDDRPYLDTPDVLRRSLSSLVRAAKGEDKNPLNTLYETLLIQMAFMGLSGIVFVLFPWIFRGRSEVADVRGGWGFLLYVACLGYGYLAVETILVHALILFVGHPTYAITVVVLSLLLASGLGSAWSGRTAASNLLGKLRWVLGAVLALGVLQATVIPKLLYATALGLPLPVRLILTFVCLFPLGFVMGIPFPLSLRIVPKEAAGLVPWGWAINGWMSVMASMLTILLSRLAGYSMAFAAAMVFYTVALALTGTLLKARRVTT